MSFEITGKLIHKYETQQVNDRFRKREFVLELEDNVNGNVYTNYAKMQLVQQKCELLDRYNEGDIVKVNFNIKGNKWERDGETRYITSLDAWRLEAGTLDAQGGAGDQSNQGYNQQQGAGGYNAGGYNGGGGANRGGYNQGGGYSQGPAQGAPANAGGSSSVADSNADDLPF
jgi:single-stranded DNA-binding protein